jgi:polar amino acid transport system ATP-binding protein
VSIGSTGRDLAQEGKSMFLATQEMPFARQMPEMLAVQDKRTMLKTAPSEQAFGNPAEPRAQQFLMQIMEAGWI